MKKNLITLGLMAVLGAPAFAETAAESPSSPHTLSGNLNLVSDYRFRGIDQTFGKPALQGGVDYSHASGFYAGNWNSNVSGGAGFPGSNLEMDFYGGYRANIGDFGIDAGAIYYYYPGSDAAIAGGLANPGTGKVKASGSIDNKEVYLGISWKFLSLKYFHAVDDYFGVPDTKGSGYWDLSASYSFGDGWGVNGHVGRLKMKDFSAASGNDADYTDWKIGVTRDVAGWVFGLAYAGTNAGANCSSGDFYCFGNTDNFANASKTRDAGRDIVLASVSKTF